MEADAVGAELVRQLDRDAVAHSHVQDERFGGAGAGPERGDVVAERVHAPRGATEHRQRHLDRAHREALLRRGSRADRWRGRGDALATGELAQRRPRLRVMHTKDPPAALRELQRAAVVVEVVAWHARHAAGALDREVVTLGDADVDGAHWL